MTAVHERAVEQARAADEEDFWLDLLPDAAQLVITAGYASPAMLTRKMRLGAALVADLLVELGELGVVGPAKDDRSRDVLVAPDGLAEVLARIATLAGEEPDDDAGDEEAGVAEVAPLVSLVKPPPDTSPDDASDWPDDEPGGELVVRPDDDLDLYQPGELVPASRRVQTLVVRARQATARGAILVVDQPVVSRSLAVGRQSPYVVGRLVKWTPRGAKRAVYMVGAWVNDSRSSTLLAKHSEAGEGEAYARVADARLKANLRQRQATLATGVGVLVLLGLAWWAPTIFAGALASLAGAAGVVVALQHRGKELLWGLVLACALAGVAWWQGPGLASLVPQPPGWVWWVAAGIAVVWFGLLGRQEDQKLMEMPSAMASTKPPAITAPMVIGALLALGNSKMKDPDSVRVLMDPHRAGDGYQIDLELPAGVTAGFVMENREKFAAAMRRNLGTVWPRVGPAHPGHLSLYISNTPVNETEQDPWPLLSSGPIDIFAPQPVFTDQLGKWVNLTLAYASWVIGAVPRMGKTFTVRELLLIYGMDPRVKVIALDGKGTGDLSSLAPFAHKHVRGARVDKPENIEGVREIVSWLLKEMGRRADILAGLPFEEAPESKITGELIDAHPELDLGPIVMGMDETQSFFSFGFRGNKEHKEIREEIRDGVIELMRMGPAVGIWLILATQTVRDSTIPSEAQAVAVYRFALKMEGWEPNDKVLGTGAFKSGIDATMFGFEEKGIGWLKGEGSKPLIVRSVVGLDAVQSRLVALRCRAFRVAKHLLTGEADEQDGVLDAEIVIDIVTDADNALTTHHRDQVQYGELLDWLREMRPEHYAELDVKELSVRLPKMPDGKSAQVWSNGRNGRGVRLVDLRERGVE